MTDTPADPIAAEAREIAAKEIAMWHGQKIVVVKLRGGAMTVAAMAGYGSWGHSPTEYARAHWRDYLSVADWHLRALAEAKSAGRAEASAVVEAARYANDPKNQISEGLFCLVPLRLALREYDAALPPPPEGGE